MISKEKKGAIFIPSLRGGGAERIALNLAQNLNHREDLEIDIVCMDTECNYPLPSNINYYYLSNLSYKQSKFTKLVDTLPQISKLDKIIRENRYDFIIPFLNRSLAMLFAYSFLFSYNFKIIVSYRNFMSSQINNFQSTFTSYIINRIIYRYVITKSGFWADMVISNSQSSRLDLIENFNIPHKKISAISNPIDTKKIQSLKSGDEKLRNIFNQLFKYHVFVTVGSLTEQKGHNFLIRTFSLVKSQAKETKLIIIGEGNLLKSNTELARKLGMCFFVYQDNKPIPNDKDIYFLGFQKNPYYFLSNAKVFVFPSLWEGFPNVLLEAIACGLLVISSDCRSGPREIISPETDPIYQTSKPEMSEFGILMPTPNSESKNGLEIGMKERLWSTVMLQSLKSEKALEKHGANIQKRIPKIRNKKIFENWYSVINTTLLES